MKLDIEVFGTRCAGYYYILSKLICLQRPRIALFLFVCIKIKVFEHYQLHCLLAKPLTVFVFISKAAGYVFFLFYSAGEEE